MRPNYRSIAGVKQRLVTRIMNAHPELNIDARKIQLPWYAITNLGDDAEEPDDATAEVLIYDEIGGSFGVSAEQFVLDLQEITAPNISVRINSPGGSVFDAIAMYNALVQHPANVTTYVDSLAASAASVVAMAGDKCVMMVGSQMMIHNAMGMEMGNAKDMRAMAEFLDRQSTNIASIYAYKAEGKTDADTAPWLELMDAETWLFAQEAVDLKLADEIYTPKPKAAPDMPGEPDEDDGNPMPGPMHPEPDEDENPAGPPSKGEAEALMARKHRLSNRGYKHAGRDRAPSPEDLIAALHRGRSSKPSNIDELVNLAVSGLR